MNKKSVQLTRLADARSYVTSNLGQERNEGDTIPRAPNDCWERRKARTMSQYFLQRSKFASERPQVRTWGRQTSFLPRAPSKLVAPLN